MASEIWFTSNPAEYSKLEGLYISERNPPGFIQGVDLSTTLIAGQTCRGPVTPQEITSTARFVEVYGGREYVTGAALKNQIWAALLNKPFGKLIVQRVCAADAVLGTVTLDDTAGAGGTNIVRIDASSKGAWSATLKVSVEAATDGVTNHWNLRVDLNGKQFLYQNLDTTAGNDNLLTVIGDDIGNLVVVTKLADGRPHNQADTLVASGADGTLVNSDYTAAVTTLANYQASGVVLVPEAAPTQATLNATIVTLAAASTDKVFLTWSGAHGNSVATEITAQAAQITTKSDRIVWCFNSPKTLDPTTAAKITQGPHVNLAAILSQTDVDVHSGSHQTAQYNAGITELTNESLTRADLISLRAAGITTLEKLPGEFLYRSVVVTDLTPGKTELTRRRMADFLQLSAASRLKYFVKAKNTVANRVEMGSELVAFSKDLMDQGRIIENFVVDQTSVNTQNQRAQGQERILWRVRLIGHMLSLVLESEIGTGVVIQAS